jgi:hypothetical protein
MVGCKSHFNKCKRHLSNKNLNFLDAKLGYFIRPQKNAVRHIFVEQALWYKGSGLSACNNQLCNPFCIYLPIDTHQV